MIAIIAVNNLGFIGKENKLPWQCSADIKHFKAMTLGKCMLVGYNTYKELPDFLKAKRELYKAGNNRYLIVDEKHLIEGVYRKPYTTELIDFICCGGKKTYEKYASQFTELHISRINDNTIGDCLFPDLSTLNTNCKIFTYNFEVNES